jgi:nucleotide-binding universal stress UspA family protein
MLKILLPVDFSEGTYQACRYALQLCPANSGTQLLLLHCFQDYLADADTDIAPPIDQTPSATIAENIIHRNESDAYEQMEALYNRLQADLQKNSTIYIEREIVHGSPEDCIPERAKQFQADLLVMHTDGDSGLGRVLFGTVTTKIVEEVKVPILTVPKDFASNSIKRVLYATDFDKADTAAIQQLQQLLQSIAPSLICVHVSDDVQVRDQARLQELQQNLQQTQDSSIQFALLPGDDVVESLLQFVKEERIDLVSLANRKHDTWDNLFNQNMAKKFVLESHFPLLIFQGKGA